MCKNLYCWNSPKRMFENYVNIELYLNSMDILKNKENTYFLSEIVENMKMRSCGWQHSAKRSYIRDGILEVFTRILTIILPVTSSMKFWITTKLKSNSHRKYSIFSFVKQYSSIIPDEDILLRSANKICFWMTIVNITKWRK